MINEYNAFLLIVVVGYFFRVASYLTISYTAWRIFYSQDSKYKSSKVLLKNRSFIPKIEITNSLVTLAIFSLSLGGLYLFRDYTRLYFDLSKFGLTYFFFQVVLLILIHDTWFYWVHRFMHIKIIYQYVHVIHHRSINPTPYAGLSFHPIEACLEGLIVPMIVFVIPLHHFSIFIWFVIMLLHVVYIHIGFEFMPRWWHKNNLTRWIITPLYHNIHHVPKSMRYNMGLYFIFWDKLMGTLKPDYHENFEKIVSRRGW